MTPHPKELALLISVIGLGLSGGAQARSALDAPRPQRDAVSADVLADTATDAQAATASGSSLDLDALVQARIRALARTEAAQEPAPRWQSLSADDPVQWIFGETNARPAPVAAADPEQLADEQAERYAARELRAHAADVGAVGADGANPPKPKLQWKAPKRPMAEPGIVVATQADKVLLSLATVAAPDVEVQDLLSLTPADVRVGTPAAEPVETPGAPQWQNATDADPVQPEGYAPPADGAYAEARYTFAAMPVLGTLPPVSLRPALPIVEQEHPHADVVALPSKALDRRTPAAAQHALDADAPARETVDAVRAERPVAAASDRGALNPVAEAASGASTAKSKPKPKRFVEPEPAIFVASQIDKVLMSLATVSGESSNPIGLLELQPKHVRVGTPKPAATARDANPVTPDIDIDIDIATLPASTDAAIDAHRARLPRQSDKVAIEVARIDAERPTMQPQAAIPAPRESLGQGWLAMNANKLDGVRGGFSTNGLNVTFGIQRAVYINGSLVTTTSLNVADVNKATAAQLLPPSLGLVQSGAGNIFTVPVSSNGTIGTLGTVVQNTLNGQRIQTITQINAVVNSLQLLKNLNLQQTMRGAVIDSLRR